MHTNIGPDPLHATVTFLQNLLYPDQPLMYCNIYNMSSFVTPNIHSGERMITCSILQGCELYWLCVICVRVEYTYMCEMNQFMVELVALTLMLIWLDAHEFHQYSTVVRKYIVIPVSNECKLKQVMFHRRIMRDELHCMLQLT